MMRVECEEYPVDIQHGWGWRWKSNRDRFCLEEREESSDRGIMHQPLTDIDWSLHCYSIESTKLSSYGWEITKNETIFRLKIFIQSVNLIENRQMLVGETLEIVAKFALFSFCVHESTKSPKIDSCSLRWWEVTRDVPRISVNIESMWQLQEMLISCLFRREFRTKSWLRKEKRIFYSFCLHRLRANSFAVKRELLFSSECDQSREEFDHRPTDVMNHLRENDNAVSIQSFLNRRLKFLNNDMRLQSHPLQVFMPTAEWFGRWVEQWRLSIREETCRPFSHCRSSRSDSRWKRHISVGKNELICLYKRLIDFVVLLTFLYVRR